MILNKNNLAVLLLIFVAGINSSYAASECYELHRKNCIHALATSAEIQRQITSDNLGCGLNEQEWEERYFSKERLLASTISEMNESIEYEKDRLKSFKSMGYSDANLASQYDRVCSAQEFKKRFLALTSSNQASKSNQTSNTGSSSNQSSSAVTSNSQVSQNKQSYQAAQLAHNQANAGKGKKHNSKAEVPECIKPNANETGFKNACNFAVNISYCFMGVMQGAKDVDKQLLSDLSCQNAQFANTELSAGEDLTGKYVGLTMGGMICKSPSQPLDMYFDSAESRALGRCSF